MANLEGMDLGSCTVLRRVPSRFADDVYRVRQAASGAQTTVRIVHATLASGHPLASPEVGAAFVRAASAVAGLEQSHILPLYDFGERNGLRYVIVPDVPDGSLADYLAPGSGHAAPLLLSTAAEITGQVAAALQHAHDAGLVHSTVSPHTVLLRQPLMPGAPARPGGAERMVEAGVEAGIEAGIEAGEALIGLADFGLSRFLPGSSMAAPRAPGLDCLAPEQREGLVLPASDQYALACVLYLLLVGRPLRVGGASGMYAPPSRLNPALSPAVDEVLAMALAADPAERYARVVDFATALWTALRPAAYAERAPAVVSVPNAVNHSSSAMRSRAANPSLQPPPVEGEGEPDGARPARPALGSFPSGGQTLGNRFAPGMPGNAASDHAPPDAARFDAVSDADSNEARMTRRRALITLGALGGAGLVAVGGGGYYAWRHHLFGPAPAPGAVPNPGVLTGYDGIGVFRPSASTFALVESWQRDGSTLLVVLGEVGDLPLAGDWNGDGVRDVGVFRPRAGIFYLKGSNSTGAPLAYTVYFGEAGDLAIAGDWLGKGHDGIGVFRPAQGLFLLKQTLGNQPPDLAITFGMAGDIPVAGDWDGDGVAGIGVYRPSDDQFYLVNTLTNNAAAKVDHTVGLRTGAGHPFAGRWGRDGKRSGVGVLLPAKGMMYLKRDATTSGPPDLRFAFGQSGDLPVAGRWAK